MTMVTLKAARVNRGLTQREAANKLGISMQTLCSYETGKVEPKYTTLKKICELYNVKFEDIFLVSI